MLNPDVGMIESFLTPSLRQAKAYNIDTPKVAVKLDQNESPFDWPEALKAKVCQKLETIAWNRYPSAFSTPLTEQIAEYAGVAAENVLTGPGTNHLIALFLSSLTRQIAGKVVVLQPSFPLYESHCLYEGTTYETWQLDKDLQFDLTNLPHLPEHSLLVFASPNNPTGSVLQKQDLAKILADNPTSFVMADEAYFEFANEQFTPLLEEFPNLIILRTCSKALGAAGVRLGYAIASTALLEEIAKLRLPYLLNHFTIAAADTFFASHELQEQLKDYTELVVRERERMIATMQSANQIQVFPSQANFFTLRSSSQDACSRFYQGLIRDGILVRNISSGPGLSGCLRVSIGNQMENDRFLESATNLLK